MSNNAVGLLLKEKRKLELEREAAIERFDREIADLNVAIERISGRKVKEIEAEVGYDDEHPDYIKASIED